ncbi:MAG: NERD domain-containing protein [Kiritimatiellia bacterium]
MQSVLANLPPSIWWILGAVVLIRILVLVLRLPQVKGAIGEWVVSLILKSGLSKQTYIILNDVYLPLPDGTTTQIDHVVVSRYGIFAVETKNYSGWIFADASSKVWTQTIYRKKSTFQNPLRQNYRHVCAIADNLGIDKSYVKGVVAFAGGCTFKTERPEGVVLASDVAKYIRSVTVQIIKDSQVPEVAEAIVAWQATLSRQQVSAHVDNLKKTHGAASETDTPRCPRCGSDMVLRTSRETGKKFFGCCNYPKCRGVIEVE